MSWANSNTKGWRSTRLKGKTGHIVGGEIQRMWLSAKKPCTAPEVPKLRMIGSWGTIRVVSSFLPWSSALPQPSAFGHCWKEVTGLDRSLIWPSPHILLFSDRRGALQKHLTATLWLAKKFVVLLRDGQGWCFTEMGGFLQMIRK